MWYNKKILQRPYYTIDDFYKYYFTRKEGTMRYIDNIRIKRLVRKAEKIIIKRLMDGDTFHMPGRLGNITVKKRHVTRRGFLKFTTYQNIRGFNKLNFLKKTDDNVPMFVWGANRAMKNRSVYTYMDDPGWYRHLLATFVINPKKYMMKGINVYGLINAKECNEERHKKEMRRCHQQ
jgi:hypothetical protein